jgi:hypothetical protein
MAKGGQMTKSNNRLATARANIEKGKETKARRKSHSKIDQRDTLKERVLTNFGHAALWHKMDDCRKPADERHDRERCGTIYCIPCYNRAIERQRERIISVFQRHTSEQAQRSHLRHVTLLFDAYGFDLWAKSYPTFPYDRTLAGIEYARKELRAMKRKFPNLVMVGGIELEPMDKDARQRRYNSKATDSLLLEGAVRDRAVGYRRISVPSGMEKWQDHIILLHAHILMDINGTDEQAFKSYCQERLGNKRKVNPVPRGVVINPLRDNKTINESIDGISRYPYKTFFHYNLPKRLKDQVPPDRYEDEILATMIVGHGALGTKRTLINIGLS